MAKFKDIVKAIFRINKNVIKVNLKLYITNDYYIKT